MEFQTFCACQQARVVAALDALPERILRRRWKIDAKAEHWFWLTVLDHETSTRRSTATVTFESDGEIKKRRIRPAWYWTDRDARRRLDPAFREKERLRSIAKRAAKKVETRGQP